MEGMQTVGGGIKVGPCFTREQATSDLLDVVEVLTDCDGCLGGVGCRARLGGGCGRRWECCNIYRTEMLVLDELDLWKSCVVATYLVVDASTASRWDVLARRPRSHPGYSVRHTKYFDWSIYTCPACLSID